MKSFNNLKIQNKMLIISLVVVVIFITIFYILGDIRQKGLYLEESMSVVDDAHQEFENLLEKDEYLLLASLDIFLENRDYRDLFLRGERDKLYEKSLPLFEILKENYSITHFYYHLPDGTNYLRVHNKDINGDVVNRYTFKEAVETKKFGVGIELGKTAYALRAVKPYFDEDNNLIGYVEFGKEIDHLLENLQEQTDNQFTMFALKEYIDFEDWKSVMNVKELENNWEDLSDFVVIDSTVRNLSDGGQLSIECFNSLYKPDLGGKEFMSKGKIYNSGETDFICGIFHVEDASGADTGFVVVMKNTSSFIDAVIASDRILIYLVVFILIFLTIVFQVSFNSYIISPIVDLKKEVEIVESGNLSHKIEVTSGDEIGQLSKAFGKMVSAVKRSREEVDKKVEEQTKEILERQKDVENQQTATLNVLDDVEKERERANIEKEKIDTLLQSIGDGVFAVDDKMKIIAFNESAEKISGFSKKEVIDKKFNDYIKFINEKDNSPADGFVNEVMSSKTVSEMPEGTLLVRKDGKKIPVADSAAPIKDVYGKIIGCIIVFRDISNKIKIDKMKSEFVSIASHQLRTPLTGIQWVSERLMKISDSLPEKERGYVNDVYMSAKRLSRLVDDLLNVSRIEGGKVAIVPERIDVVKFLNDYFQEIQPLVIQKNITLTLEKEEESIEMNTDRSALQNIYQSLISNAIEYTPEEGEVIVRLKKSDKNVLFEVTDTGIGIPKNDQETIFEKFTRGVNAVEVKTDGTGFGLYIAKQTTDLLGGEISFETEENKGTTFFVKLPIESKAIAGEKKLS